MTTLVRLIAAVWNLIVGAAADLANWLRRPGSKLKAVCAVLAAFALFSAINSYTRGVRIASLQQRIVVIQGECETRVGALQGDIDERDARLAEIATALREEADKLELLRAESAAALGQLADELDAAERDAAVWHQRYESRPDTCQAALELLDSACPSLGGY
ncbi:hypothetical protein ABE488_09190 [Luteimonas sp. TWI662]|uniref:hypothetical protein n=1 Tax=Luteimonas sp. TWI662 TaxID=3136789 RepID=UPI00320B927D